MDCGELGFSFEVKVHTLKKIAAPLREAKLLSIFLATLCVAQHGLYTSNMLPMPMYRHRQHTYSI